MKATTLLKKQHRKVEDIFEKLESEKSSSLVMDLANELAAHMAIEQNIFYPAAREIDREMVDESYEEHAIAELALKRLLSTPSDDPTFEAKVTALRELIEHHVEEEEEELFSEVEDQMDPKRLQSLADEMTAAFEEATEAGYEALLGEGLEASGDTAAGRSTEAPARAIRRGRVRPPRTPAH